MRGVPEPVTLDDSDFHYLVSSMIAVCTIHDTRPSSLSDFLLAALEGDRRAVLMMLADAMPPVVDED